jgi:hypothetical protein
MRAAVLCLVLLSACRAYDDLPLLEIDSIGPSEIEPGAILRIHGEGFPLGQSPEIQLRGSVYRPGKSPSEISARLAGIVQSDSLIEVPIDEALIVALGGRATVDGELRVGFAAADGHRDVFASEPTRIDFLPDTPTQLRAQSLREERISTEPLAAEAFGLELSREELGTAGVRVLSVDPEGLAAKQGVRPADLVVGLDGIRIYSWRDFVPDPSKRDSTVYVARDGLRGIHALHWPHEVSEPQASPWSLALFVLLGLGLGWVSPAALGVRARFSTIPSSAWAVRAGLVLVFAGLLALVPSLQWATMWILVLGTFAALSTLVTRDRAGASSFAFAVASALTVMLLARSASLEAIAAAQRPPLLRWYLFQSPASFLAFGAYLHALGRLCARPRLSASLYGGAAAVLGAALFLGGMPFDQPAKGMLALSCKALIVLWAARGFEVERKTALGMTLLALMLAFLDFAVDLERLLPEWSPLAVGCVCALGARIAFPPLRRSSAPVAV